MGTQRRQPRSQTGRTNYRPNDFNANSFHKESFPTFKWWLHSTLHWESALWCLLTHWEITWLLWWKWLPCREKGSKLLIGGWSLAEVWLIGKWLLLRYISWRPTRQPQQLVQMVCFVIETAGLFSCVAVEVVFCSMAAPSELSLSLHKEGSVKTQVCTLSYLVQSLTGLPSNALGCLTALT